MTNIQKCKCFEHFKIDTCDLFGLRRAQAESSFGACNLEFY